MSRPTQPFIPPGSKNEDHLRLERQWQIWFISFVDKRVGVQVKLCVSMTTRAIPERFYDVDASKRELNQCRRPECLIKNRPAHMFEDAHATRQIGDRKYCQLSMRPIGDDNLSYCTCRPRADMESPSILLLMLLLLLLLLLDDGCSAQSVQMH